jgi:segregation and condensation protein B
VSRESAEPPARPDPCDLETAVEAALFVGKGPLDPADLARALPPTRPEEFERILAALGDRYRQERRPYHLTRSAEGYRLRLLPEFAEPLKAARMGEHRGVRLNRPAIETLSVVAYRQPIDRGAIEDLVGYDPSATLRQLVRRQLLATRRDPDGQTRYSTTPRFLALFSLGGLEELPTLADLTPP